MALAELIGRLERDAQSRADALAKQARDEIARLESEADRAAGQLRSGELAVRRERRRARLERELAEARAQSRAEVLRARERLIDRVFHRAGELLPSLREDRRVRRWLEASLEAAGGYLDGGLIRVAPELTEGLSSPTGLELIADASVPLGARLASKDGHLTIELTLERALERARPALSIALAKELPR